MNTSLRPGQLLAPVLLALGSAALFAQGQFAELHKQHLPISTANARAVVAADVDKDGDLDLLFSNNEVVGGAQNRLYLNQGGLRFVDATATHLPVGFYNTHVIATGDVDGDGDIDFVTGDTWQNRLYRNDGAGRFADATFGNMPYSGDETRRLLLVDVDGDKDLDLVGGNYRQETLALNDGTGRFVDVTATHVPVDTESTWDIDAGDVDGDGDVDLVLANFGKGRLYLNDGTGRFSDATAARLPAMSPNSSSFRLADLDGDGDLDAFVSFWNAPAQLLRNDGQGTFVDVTAGRLPPLPPQHWQAVLGDVDQDGDLDIAYSTIEAEHLLLNDGQGKFSDVSAAQLPPSRSATLGLCLADLDGDQDLDWIEAAAGQPNRLFANDGKGRFTDMTPQSIESPWTGARAIVLGDLDGDADLDMITAGADYGEAIENDQLLLGDGNGHLLARLQGGLPQVQDDTRALALFDADADGDLDVVLGNLREQSRLLLNDGSAGFGDVTAALLPAGKHATLALAHGDVDGDGDIDLVLGNLGERCRLWLNAGNAKFSDVTATQLPALSYETRALVLGDVDGDGDLDLFLGNGLTQGQTVALWLNDGKGTFQDASAGRMPTSSAFPTASLAAGDVDGDGDLDLVVGNDGLGVGRYNRLYLNDGQGRFADRSLVYDYYRTFALALADVDDDGDLDVVCGDYDDVDKLYLNDGKGRFMNASWPRMPIGPSRTVALAIGDLDRDGDLDLVRGSDWQRMELLHNHLRQISAALLPQLGRSWTVDLHAEPDFMAAPTATLPLLATAPASIPIAPWGRLGLDPSGLIVLPPVPLAAPSGHGQLALPIPNAPDLVGKSLFLQALVLHENQLLKARFTNVIEERIVR